MNKYLLLLSFFMLSACGGIENQSVDFDAAKNNPLLVPPCLNK